VNRLHYYWCERFEVILTSPEPICVNTKGHVELQELDSERRFVVSVAQIEHTTEMGVLARVAM
jgi:hypothetical protein